MQQKLILYIGNKGNLGVYTEADRVDQFKDESVSFTQTIQNVKDIKKIFTEFTKTFALPASPRNNKLFKHYYNFDISDNSAFDGRVKVGASLELNDILFKTGKIALTGVELKNNVPHTYKVTFYGNTVDLKDILGDAQLSFLEDLESENKTYNFTSVFAGFSAASNADIIVPLITHTDRLFYYANGFNENGNVWYSSSNNQAGADWQQFKYAIRLSRIIDAIQVQYPITFSNDFFNNTSNTDFHNLFMWLHRKKGAVEAVGEVEIIWSRVTSLPQTLCAPLPCNVNATSNNGVITINIIAGFILKTTTVSLQPTTNDEYSARVTMINANGDQSIVGSFNNQVGYQVMGNINELPPGPFDNNAQYFIEVAPTDPTVTLQFASNSIMFLVGTRDLRLDSGSYGDYCTQQFRNTNAFFTSQIREFNIQEQIPKMKIIDFLTGIFQMFNLTAYVEGETIVVQTLDEFYNKAPQTVPPIGEDPEFIGVEIDKYLDVTKSTVDIALPYKSVNFAYKGLKTFLAQQFEQLNNKGWGSTTFDLNEYFDAPTEKYNITVPFEHVQYERLFNQATGGETAIQYGYFVDSNREPYYGDPLIFYGYKRTSATPFSVRKNAGLVYSTSNYWLPMNTKTLNSSSSKVNINFHQELSEYKANADGADAALFSDTLLNKYYKTYLTEVFQRNRRLTKVTAYLPYKIFSSLQLYDRIRFRQQNYKINSMTTNLTTGKTEFELLNSDL